MSINRHPGTNSIDAGESRQGMSVRGCLLSKVGTFPTQTGSEEVMATFVVPRKTLCSDGKSLRLFAIFTTAANGNNKTVQVRTGSLTGTSIYTSGALTSNNTAIMLDLYIVRISATSYFVYGTCGGVVAFTTDTADAINDGVTLVITGTTPSSAADLTLKAAWVEMLPEGAQNGGSTP